MNKIIQKNQNGFTLIEVLIGMTVFAIGILGVAAMQLSAIKGNSYSSHLSEASTFTQNKIEEIILLGYDDSVLLDDDGDGVEDDDGDGVDDGNGTAGLDYPFYSASAPNAPKILIDETLYPPDGKLTSSLHTLYWNIAVDEPTVGSKTIRLITTWTEKGTTKKVTMDYIKANL